MSEIREAKNVDLGAFPGATFVVVDTPPIAQCQETQLTLLGCSWPPSGSLISIAGLTLDDIIIVGKKVTIAGTAADDGTYDILEQTTNTITIDHTFTGSDAGNTCIAHDTGQTYLTRNKQSFAKYIHDNSKAYTIKGGQLYTNIADPPMNGACSDTWSPK